MPRDAPRPTTDWPIYYAVNHVAVEISDLMQRKELTEAERELLRAAWRIVTDVQGSIGKREGDDQ